MSSNIDLKELWNKQQTAIPEAAAFLEKAKSFRRRILVRLVVCNFLLVGTSVFIMYIWRIYQPQMLITKVGIVLMIFAMAMYLFVYNQLMPALMKVGYDASNSDNLRQLLALKEKQRFLNTTILNTYFILLLTGICLYMVEPTMGMTRLWAVIAYALTLAWFAFNWFYTRPRTIKRQGAKINELISRCRVLQQQLEG